MSDYASGPRRQLCNRSVSAVSLGCMNLSHAYGVPPAREYAISLIHRALDLGVTHLDTAALYGFGRNEELVGEALAGRRRDVLLASKCGMTGVDSKRVIDGRPDTLRRTCLDSLARLRTDYIDLYYLHRVDPSVPVEESVGALAELVRAGHIGHIGLSEVSATTLRRAQAIHPISAVQSEFSVWTRNPAVAVLSACREVGATFVAFSPLARGFFASDHLDPSTFAPKDIRREMPRFQEPNYSENALLREPFARLASGAGLSAAQLALGWVLAQDPGVIAIPGTTDIGHLEENCLAGRTPLSAALADAIEALINPASVKGPRYNATTQAEIDTEELP